ncbi:MAG: DUF5317 family protein [Euryarchaeota archaeon]|nr:DUF5317 family protein [Euryarchaeota archaeon]
MIKTKLREMKKGKWGFCLMVVIPLSWGVCYLCTGIILSLVLSVLTTGSLMNWIAAYRNGGRMPVYCSELETRFFLDDIDHVIEPDKSKIKSFFLCDIMHISFLAFSVGDLFVTGSLIACALFVLTVII